MDSPAVTGGSDSGKGPVHKAVACVVRRDPGEPRLLVFRHPSGDVQVPKGSIESGESPDAAVLRELQEESGIGAVSIRTKVGAIPMRLPAGPGNLGRTEDQLYHTYWLEPEFGLPESWDHIAVGSAEEEGLTFSFFWVALPDARAHLHPRYHLAVSALEEFLSTS